MNEGQNWQLDLDMMSSGPTFLGPMLLHIGQETPLFSYQTWEHAFF